MACFDCKKVHYHNTDNCECPLTITDCAIFGSSCKRLEYMREGHDIGQCPCRCATFCRSCKVILSKKNNGHAIHESDHGAGCFTCASMFYAKQGHCFHVYEHGARCCHDDFTVSAPNHDFFVNDQGRSACRTCAYNT